MINVFVKRGFSDIWNPYLYEWGGSAHGFDIHTYEDLRDLQALSAGPVIFSDIERLTRSDRQLAADVERVIAATRPDIPLLNSPISTRRRYDLLSELYQEGLNSFRAYRLTDTTVPERFPVFLRYENDHAGAATGILRDQRELDRAIVRARLRQHDLRELIIVEFLDTISADGLYTKYSAYKVGEMIVPRGVEVSREWVVKFGVSIKNAKTSSAAHDYVLGNPHRHLLEGPFDVGGIGYGRIDYAMSGNSVVTWEINTNPTIMSPRRETHPASVSRQDLFLAQFSAALDRISPERIDRSPISLADVQPDLRSASRSEPPSTMAPLQRFGRRYKRWLDPAVRVAEFASIPFGRQIVDHWRRTN